jgi:hypothetical protein
LASFLTVSSTCFLGYGSAKAGREAGKLFELLYDGRGKSKEGLLSIIKTELISKCCIDPEEILKFLTYSSTSMIIRGLEKGYSFPGPNRCSPIGKPASYNLFIRPLEERPAASDTPPTEPCSRLSPSFFL